MNDTERDLMTATELAQGLVTLLNEAQREPSRREAIPDLVGGVLEQVAIAVTLAIGPPRFVAETARARGIDAAEVAWRASTYGRAAARSVSEAMLARYSEGRISEAQLRDRVRTAFTAMAIGTASSVESTPLVPSQGGSA